MPTTPNYGWPTPASTDLVKDGATAIQNLGNSADSTVKTVSNAVVAAQATADAAIAKSLVDAKGDLIVGTADNTVARLAVGADNYVLTADSTQSGGVKWAAAVSGGLTWTQRTQITASTNAIRSIAHNGTNLYVAAGKNGQLLTSPDGKTWTSRTSGFGGNEILRVAYGNGLWVAVGQNGTITTSTDGTTWTARTSNMGTNQITDVKYANSLWVAVGNGGGTTNTGGITYSTDGLTWTRKSQSLTVGAFYYAVIWNGTNWVVGANASTNNYLYASTPSGTWTAGQADGSSTINVLGLWYDGTRTIVYTDNQNYLKYTTGTTLATLTGSYQNQYYPFQSSYSSQRGGIYYNGKMYWADAFLMSASTTPVSTDYSAEVLNLGLAPSTYASGSFATPTTTSSVVWAIDTIFVNATGVIVAGTLGTIWTSF